MSNSVRWELTIIKLMLKFITLIKTIHSYMNKNKFIQTILTIFIIIKNQKYLKIVYWLITRSFYLIGSIVYFFAILITDRGFAACTYYINWIYFGFFWKYIKLFCKYIPLNRR